MPTSQLVEKVRVHTYNKITPTLTFNTLALVLEAHNHKSRVICGDNRLFSYSFSDGIACVSGLA